MKVSMLRGPVVAALTALTLVACSETTTSPDITAQMGKGVSAPNTEVNAKFVVYIDGQEVLLPAGTSVPGGKCLAGGVFSNHPGQQAGVVPHPKCVTSIAGYELTITWSEIANYVLATSGNVNLNFSPICNEFLICTPRNIQYKKNGDATSGTGVLTGTDQNGGVWTVALTQPYVNTITNVIVRNGTLVDACNVDLGCHPGYLKW